MSLRRIAGAGSLLQFFTFFVFVAAALVLFAATFNVAFIAASIARLVVRIVPRNVLAFFHAVDRAVD